MPRLNANTTTTSRDSSVNVTATEASGSKFALDVSVMDLFRGQTILFATINATSSGANTIVAAVPAKKIKVLSYSFVVDSAVTVKWQSASTDKSGAMSFAANGGISTPVGSPSFGWLLETAADEALNINLGGAVGVRGHISYFLES